MSNLLCSDSHSGIPEQRDNLTTGNENALNFADMAHAIGIQRGSSATVEIYQHWTDSLQLPYSQN